MLEIPSSPTLIRHLHDASKFPLDYVHRGFVRQFTSQ